MHFFLQKKEYGRVESDDHTAEDEELIAGKKDVMRNRRTWLGTLMPTALLVLGTAMSTTFVTLAVLQHTGRLQYGGIQQNMQELGVVEELHCGESVEEAKARGCSFDQLTLLWLPQECARTANDAFLEFSESNPSNMTWNYWVDEDAQVPVLDVSLQVNQDGFWTNQREHVSHCAFQFMRLVDAARGDGIFDYKTWSKEHGHHCAKVLLDRAMTSPGIDEDMQWARVKFGTCSRRAYLGKSE